MNEFKLTKLLARQLDIEQPYDKSNLFISIHELNEVYRSTMLTLKNLNFDSPKVYDICQEYIRINRLYIDCYNIGNNYSNNDIVPYTTEKHDYYPEIDYLLSKENFIKMYKGKLSDKFIEAICWRFDNKLFFYE